MARGRVFGRIFCLPKPSAGCSRTFATTIVMDRSTGPHGAPTTLAAGHSSHQLARLSRLRDAVYDGAQLLDPHLPPTTLRAVLGQPHRRHRHEQLPARSPTPPLPPCSPGAAGRWPQRGSAGRRPGDRPPTPTSPTPRSPLRTLTPDNFFTTSSDEEPTGAATTPPHPHCPQPATSRRPPPPSSRRSPPFCPRTPRQREVVRRGLRPPAALAPTPASTGSLPSLTCDDRQPDHADDGERLLHSSDNVTTVSTDKYANMPGRANHRNRPCPSSNGWGAGLGPTLHALRPSAPSSRSRHDQRPSPAVAAFSDKVV
eukprot:COSAG04_NODE_831_length_10013_cov_78.138894_10_plen_313_part_00